MTDQCKHCELSGDLPKCKDIECSQHENWYAVEQQNLIDDLQSKVSSLLADKAELQSSNARLRECANSVLGEMQVLLENQPKSFIDGSVLVDGESAHDLQRGIAETPSQSLSHIEARGVRKFVEAYSQDKSDARMESWGTVRCDAKKFAKELEDGKQ